MIFYFRKELNLCPRLVLIQQLDMRSEIIVSVWRHVNVLCHAGPVRRPRQQYNAHHLNSHNVIKIKQCSTLVCNVRETKFVTKFMLLYKFMWWRRCVYNSFKVSAFVTDWRLCPSSCRRARRRRVARARMRCTANQRHLAATRSRRSPGFPRHLHRREYIRDKTLYCASFSTRCPV